MRITSLISSGIKEIYLEINIVMTLLRQPHWLLFFIPLFQKSIILFVMISNAKNESSTSIHTKTESNISDTRRIYFLPPYEAASH